jgi:serine/threonine-protein kinase
MGTSEERVALARVLAAHRRGVAGEALRTLAARIHVQRAEPERALELLDGLSSTPALLLAADLRAERGDLARALALVERVLCRDIDTPGARERHERWRSALGVATASNVAGADQPTVLRSEAPETSLRIISEAGRGGAGTVYEAIDDVLGRRVALKVYHQPDRERDKLEREARMAVELAGPGIVRVFDADLARGMIVMEWLGGGALARWLVERNTNVLSPVERWLVPLLGALARIHAAGIVHGDIKPANVMFRSVHEPVLSDFGVASKIGVPLLGGSLGYMSPERLVDPVARAAEDVYAVGRIVEDVLDVVGESPKLRALACRCVAPESERPADAPAALECWATLGQT